MVELKAYTPRLKAVLLCRKCDYSNGNLNTIRLVDLCVLLTHTFIKYWSKYGQIVLDSGAVPPAATELVLTFLDSQFDSLRYTGHDLNVIAAEAQLFWHQARYGATQDGL